MTTDNKTDEKFLHDELMKRAFEASLNELRNCDDDETFARVVAKITLIAEMGRKDAADSAVENVFCRRRENRNAAFSVTKWAIVAFFVAPILLFLVVCARLAVFFVQLDDAVLTRYFFIILGVVAIVLIVISLLVALCAYLFAAKSIGEKSRALEALEKFGATTRDLTEPALKVIEQSTKT